MNKKRFNETLTGLKGFIRQLFFPKLIGTFGEYLPVKKISSSPPPTAAAKKILTENYRLYKNYFFKKSC